MQSYDSYGIKITADDFDKYHNEYSLIKEHIDRLSPKFIKKAGREPERCITAWARIKEKYFLLCTVVDMNKYEENKPADYQAYWSVCYHKRFQDQESELLSEIPEHLLKYITEDIFITLSYMFEGIEEGRLEYNDPIIKMCEVKFGPKEKIHHLDKHNEENKLPEEQDEDIDDEYER